MKLLWTLACILTALSAIERSLAEYISDEPTWWVIAMFSVAAVGWFIAAFNAATARADWI